MDQKQKIEIPDPENLLNEETGDSYSANMDKLFAEDQNRVKEKETTAKPMIFFTAAGFLRTDQDSQKVGVILNTDPRDDQLYLVMYDKEKTVLRRIAVENVTFEFVEEELTVILMSQDQIVFIDHGDFLRFAITALIRSSQQQCFILQKGGGDREISSDSALLYDRTVYRTDEKSLALPVEQKGIKTKLSEEKLETHQIYKWFRGLRRGSHLLIKSGEEVHEIIIVKEKKQAGFPVEDVMPEISPPPEPEPEKPPEDLRDTLHRIVGIELDRIEMRLNAKFEQFRLDINSRLDQQTELLQKLLDHKHS